MKDRMKEIQQELDDLNDKLASRELAKSHLKDSYLLLDELKDERQELYRILQKEEADVNKLESMSVNALFRHFLRNIDEQLEIEHQEYVVAALKYNECIDALQLVEYEVDLMERLIGDEDQLIERQKVVLIKKELAVKESYPEIASQLNNLDYKITRRQMELKEINEAITAGTKANVKLIEIDKMLAKVEHWGAWQNTQHLSKYSKSSFVDRARKTAVETKLLLGKFEKELNDVFKNLNIKDDLTLDAFVHFLSIFYDNMLTDWIVQNNLRHTRNSFSGTVAKVERLIASLNHEKKLIQGTIRDFKMQKRNLITTST